MKKDLRHRDSQEGKTRSYIATRTRTLNHEKGEGKNSESKDVEEIRKSGLPIVTQKQLGKITQAGKEKNACSATKNRTA